MTALFGSAMRAPEYDGAIYAETNAMEDRRTEQTVLAHIDRLVSEEHRLETVPAPSDAERARLAAVAVELDQCWDLLRQRRAMREFGKDPEAAQVRPPETVEKYTG